MAHASAAACARVLRVMSSDPISYMREVWKREGYAGQSRPLGLHEWVAGALPMCQNLTALHLRSVQIVQVPALPLLVHLILEECVFGPALVASLQGLVRLETLHVSGSWASKELPVWDISACTRLRRVFMGSMLAYNLEKYVKDLHVPPACTVALAIYSQQGWHRWLVQLGTRLAHLRIMWLRAEEAMSRTFFLHAPELTQLQHVTLIVARPQMPGSLCVAPLAEGPAPMFGEPAFGMPHAAERAGGGRGACQPARLTRGEPVRSSWLQAGLLLCSIRAHTGPHLWPACGPGAPEPGAVGRARGSAVPGCRRTGGFARAKCASAGGGHG